MIAVRDNKQIKIQDSEKATYLALGYDIFDVENGALKLVENAPGKTVPYSKYKEALDKIATLEAEIDAINKTAKK